MRLLSRATKIPDVHKFLGVARGLCTCGIFLFAGVTLPYRPIVNHLNARSSDSLATVRSEAQSLPPWVQIDVTIVGHWVGGMFGV